MRIERLRLTAYGRFTDAELDLSGAGLTIVYGPNGTGKTTTLSAVPDLLFGVAERTRYGFLHGNARIALGADLAADNGETLTVVRRKGRGSTLSAPDGTAIEEARLAALLGGLDRGEYETSFVLTQEELRNGGAELARGGGRLGEILFQARGLRGYTEALRKLRLRKDAIYLQRGQKPALNRALSAYDRQRRQVRELALSPQNYAELQAAVAAAEKRAKDADAQVRRLTVERDRLRTVRQSLGLLARRRDAVEECARLTAEGPFVPLSVGEELAQVQERLRAAVEERGRCDRELDRVGAQLAGIVVDRAVLDHAAEIDRLCSRLEVVREDRDRIAEITERLATDRAAADEAVAAVRAHLIVDGDDASAPAVPPEARERITALATKDAELAAREADARKAEERLRREAEEAAAEVAAVAAPFDDARLRAALDVAREAGSPEKDLAAARQTVRGLAESITARLTALQLPDRPPATADALPVPGAARVEEHRKRLGACGEQVERCRQELAAARDQVEQHGRALDVLLRGDAPPSEEEVAATRARRDEALRGLRAALVEAARDGAVEGAAVRRAVGLADEVAVAVPAADVVVDRMRREAAAVHERRRLEEARDSEARRAEELAGRLVGLEAASVEARKEWEALWQPLGATVVPAPDDATDVLHRLAQAASDAAQLRTSEAQVAELAELVGSLRAALTRELRAVGPGLADDATLAELVRAAQRGLEDNAAVREKHHAAGERIRHVRAERDRAAEHTADLAAERAAWAEQWSAALRAASLAGTTDPVRAAALLNEAAGAERLAQQVREAEAEVERLRARVVDFAARGRALVGALGGGDEEADAVVVAERLAGMVSVAREGEQQRGLLAARLRELEDDRAHADDEHDAAQERLAALLTAHQLPDEAELERRLARSRRHAALESDIAAVDGDLADVGMAVAELRRLAEEWDGPALAARVEELDRQVSEAAAEAAGAHEELGQRQEELRRHDGSAAAAEAQEQAQIELAAAVQNAEEYLRLHLAEKLLVDEIERYRTQNQNTVLARAEELLDRLTLGEYPKLEAVTDDEGHPVLEVSDRDGSLRRADQLNEGARDQLYLALRLATLDSYAEAGRRLPLLLDDVFVSFDDARTPAGLDVLAGVSDRFQIIVLTHHAAVADAARTLDRPVGVATLQPFAPLPAPAPPTPRASAAVPAARVAAATPASRACRGCGTDLPAPTGRGRPPVLCPSCRAARP